MHIIDLRSDTVTQPTKAMREMMASAPVGDDVYGEDPSVRQLEERMADTLGKEAGLFIASGTMGNLVALLAHVGRGEEVILGDLSHIFLLEGGNASALGSIHPHILPNPDNGTLDLEQIQLALRNPDHSHAPRTKMIVLENTHNLCGGIALTADYCNEVASLAAEHGLIMHLDGARVFNAALALDCPVTDLVEPFSSVMVCLSKSLGAPVGSVLCGSRNFIHEAHRMRKMVGGGMRQAGILAAAGVYALDNNIKRLATDHENAHLLALGIAEIDGLTCPQAQAPATGAWTNLVFFTVDGAAIGRPQLTVAELSNQLRIRGILANVLGSDGKEIRMVTHLDVEASDIETTLVQLQLCLSEI